MPQLTGKSGIAVYKLSIHNNAASQSGPQSNNHKVFHPFGTSVYELAQCRCIGIVGEDYGDVLIVVFELVNKGDYTFPVKVGRIFYCTLVIVAVRGTYAYTCNSKVVIY